MGELIRSIDQSSIAFLVWLQGYQNSGFTAVMRFFSYLGTEYFFLLLLPFIYWTISKKWGALVAFSLILASYMAGFIKWTFNIPRPPSPPVTHLWSESSPSFISGHATIAMALWGTMAALVRKTAFWILATILIFFIGFSRLYLGVHYPADVIGGWLMGAVIAWLVLTFSSQLEIVLSQWSVARMLITALAVSLLMVFIHPRWPEANLWPAPNAIQLGGLFFGMSAGLVWDEKSLHFQVDGSWGQRLVRLLLGLSLLVIAYLGPKIIINQMSVSSFMMQQTLRFGRYALVGFTVSGLAPWFFQRLRLSGAH